MELRDGPIEKPKINEKRLFRSLFSFFLSVSVFPCDFLFRKVHATHCDCFAAAPTENKREDGRLCTRRRYEKPRNLLVSITAVSFSIELHQQDSPSSCSCFTLDEGTSETREFSRHSPHQTTLHMDVWIRCLTRRELIHSIAGERLECLENIAYFYQFFFRIFLNRLIFKVTYLSAGKILGYRGQCSRY